MSPTTQTPRQAEVREHPAGGYTIARPVGSGTARIYDGQFATREAAERELQFCASHRLLMEGRAA